VGVGECGALKIRVNSPGLNLGAAGAGASTGREGAPAGGVAEAGGENDGGENAGGEAGVTGGVTG
jgi:hypothetical protein